MRIGTVDVSATDGSSPTRYACVADAGQSIRESEDHRVVAICAAAAALNARSACQRQIDIKNASAAVNFPRQHCIQLYKRQPIMLRKRLTRVVVVGVADGPAVQRRHACYAIEDIALSSLCRASVGRADDGPRGPVPALGQGLVIVANIVAGGPAVRCRHARHADEDVVLRTTRRLATCNAISVAWVVIG